LISLFHHQHDVFFLAATRSTIATLSTAVFAAWRYFFEYSSWRNLDWFMVATEGDSDEGNDGNVRGQGNVEGSGR